VRKLIAVVLFLGLPVDAVDARDGGSPALPEVDIQIRDVSFDGTRLKAIVSLVGLREVLIDTRLDYTPVLRPAEIRTCEGEWVTFWSPSFLHEVPARGEELLLKPGYRFERPVDIYYLKTKLQPGACVDIKMRLRGPFGEDEKSRVLGTTTVRTTVTAKQ
jgi:hypothetical protein